VFNIFSCCIDRADYETCGTSGLSALAYLVNRSQWEASVSCPSTAVSNYDMDTDYRRVHMLMAQRSRKKGKVRGVTQGQLAG
jgi:hypothetical protein